MNADTACYRYRTLVLIGPWRRTCERALQDAAAAGQVERREDGSLDWIIPGDIQKSPCVASAPCGGVYPGPDEATPMRPRFRRRRGSGA